MMDARDNAVSSFTKILQFRPDLFENMEVAYNQLLGALPLTHDKIEARYVHGVLCDFLMDKYDMGNTTLIIEIIHLYGEITILI